MKTLTRQCLVLTAAVLTAVPAAFADFTYTETTQVTGGSMLAMMKMAGAFSKQARQMGQPVVSTVVIKGNRMAHLNPDQIEIIDLDAETITTIDRLKKQYTVVTFEQMKEQIEAATKKAQEQQQKSQPEPAQQPSDTQVKFSVHVRNTGQSKQVAGLGASEAIMTMNMDATDTSSGQTGSLAITNDMWLAAEIPGYDEVKEFYRKFALKMGTVFSGAVNPAMLAQYRGASQGLGDMAEEMSKLKGTPVLQVTRMGMTTNGQPLPAASEAPLPASDNPQTPSAGDVAKQSVTSSIAGAFGGFGGFGHKKQAAPAPAPAPAPAASDSSSGTSSQPAYSVLMETNTQLTSFSQTADLASFEIPAGFKQIQTKGLN